MKWNIVPVSLLALILATPALAGDYRGPIIDAHTHSGEGVETFLPAGPPNHYCHDPFEFVDPTAAPMKRAKPSLDDIIRCNGKVMTSPMTDDDFRRKTMAEWQKNNFVLGYNSDTDIARMDKWAAESPMPLVPALLVHTGGPSPEQARELVKAGKLKMIGEIAVQYNGLGPADPYLDPYYAIAREFDLPVGVHIGLGAPGNNYIGYSEVNGYKADVGRPLAMEGVLRKYPGLRLYVMHAGWPHLEEMIHLLYQHPQVYVDISMINWTIPRKEFHRYLKQLVDAGFASRLMFGTDNAAWPEAVSEGVDAINAAEFLTDQQKADIFFNNAIRFFRLDPKQVLAGARGKTRTGY
ncbi:MAG: amidohydrolase family protein [Novosphingobium sp.]|jgi:predicted TIM-barrel fold metal-dependent hydrolase|nr:amidohydrolase family protein [Novosphingobium sp.]